MHFFYFPNCPRNFSNHRECASNDLFSKKLPFLLFFKVSLGFQKVSSKFQRVSSKFSYISSNFQKCPRNFHTFLLIFILSSKFQRVSLTFQKCLRKSRTFLLIFQRVSGVSQTMSLSKKSHTFLLIFILSSNRPFPTTHNFFSNANFNKSMQKILLPKSL